MPLKLSTKVLWPHFFKRGLRLGPMAMFQTWPLVRSYSHILNVAITFTYSHVVNAAIAFTLGHVVNAAIAFTLGHVLNTAIGPGLRLRLEKCGLRPLRPIVTEFRPHLKMWPKKTRL